MDNLPIIATGGVEAIVAGIGQTFGVNLPSLVAQAICFLVVAAVLNRFVLRPLLAAADQRRQQIEEGLTKAKASEAELAEAQVQRQAILEAAHREAEQVIAEAKAAATTVLEQSREAAVAVAERQMQLAREEMALERARLEASLRGEIARLVAETAARVTGKLLTDADRERLRREALDLLAA